MSGSKLGRTRRLRLVRDGDHGPGLAVPDTTRVERAFAAMAARLSQARTVAEADRLQLTVVHTLAGAKTSFVCRLHAQRAQLQISSVRGRNDPRVAAAAPGKGPVGISFARAAIFREDGCVVVPLPGGETPAGCLVLLGARAQLPDELLTAVAAQIGAASEVARWREEAARRTKDLETAVAGLKGLERNRDQLLANVSHDLKNPLTTLKTYLTLLQRGKLGSLEDRARNAVEICQRNSDRLLRMINDLILVSRLEEGKIELDDRPFGLNAVVEQAREGCALLAEQTSVILAFRAGAEVFVRGNRTHLGEAVLYVLEYALQVTPAGETVIVTLSSNDGLARLQVLARRSAVRQKDVDRALGGLHRTHAELGLPIAAKIVRLHGGRVAAQVQPKVGCALEIALPIFAAAVALPPSARTASDGSVLLVEDDRDCREVLHQVLEAEGYPVTSAATCQQALAALARSRPALVLLDLRLSDGDGRSVLQHIREDDRLKGVPVYVISGSSDAAEITSQLGAHVDGLLEKPLQLGKLLSVVGAAVRPASSMVHIDK